MAILALREVMVWCFYIFRYIENNMLKIIFRLSPDQRDSFEHKLSRLMGRHSSMMIIKIQTPEKNGVALGGGSGVVMASRRGARQRKYLVVLVLEHLLWTL